MVPPRTPVLGTEEDGVVDSAPDDRGRQSAWSRKTTVFSEECLFLIDHAEQGTELLIETDLGAIPPTVETVGFLAPTTCDASEICEFAIGDAIVANVFGSHFLASGA